MHREEKYLDINLEELLNKLNIHVIEDRRMNDKKNDAVLITGKMKSIVYLKDTLEDNYKNFLLLHECGHCIYHFQKNGKYSYIQSTYCGRLEKEANEFACKFLLEGENISGTNIIELLKNKGVPHKIAVQFCDSKVLTFGGTSI